MINVAQSRAHVASIEGDIVAMPKAQMAELLNEVEAGQYARRQLTNLRTMINLAANTAATPA